MDFVGSWGVVGWGFCYLLQLIVLRLGCFVDKHGGLGEEARFGLLWWEEGDVVSEGLEGVLEC